MDIPLSFMPDTNQYTFSSSPLPLFPISCFLRYILIYNYVKGHLVAKDRPGH